MNSVYLQKSSNLLWLRNCWLLALALAFNFTATAQLIDNCEVTNINTSEGLTITVDADETKTVTLTNTHNGQSNYIYVTTRQEGSNYFITGFVSGDEITVSGSEVADEPLIVWGLSYSGQLLAQVGDNLMNTRLASDCFNISRNCVMFIGGDEGNPPPTGGCPAPSGDCAADGAAGATLDCGLGEPMVVEVICSGQLRIVYFMHTEFEKYEVYDDICLTNRLGIGNTNNKGWGAVSFVGSADPTDVDYLVEYDAENCVRGVKVAIACGVEQVTDAECDNQNLREVTLPQAETSTVTATVYPNPAQEQVNLQLAQVPAGQLIVTVYGLNGQVVKRQVVANDFAAATQTLNLNVANLNTGMYSVQVQGAGFTKSLRFVKQ